ncbi:hypothetical protein BDN70DRAFT_199230 [Pholiota conissans]|uniref:F-box domain-containing protein n=1 Tax=Pholiota conissans TaxID=109636 RepID=A0A9P6CWV4_9AGAR|nr:hypothetical protein BDN70DRAFT_199230 [Pholiota conissans]
MASDTSQNRHSFTMTQDQALPYLRGVVGTSSHRPDAYATYRELAELDKKINYFQVTLAAMERRRLLLRMQVNDLTRRVPLEIVSMIFRYSLPDDIISISLSSKKATRYAVSAPLVLSAVCQSWRSIAHSIPQLWTTIPLRVGPSNARSLPLIAKNWMNRAGRRPLSMNIYAPISISQELMQVINQSSPWMNLKYEGIPENLSQFSSTAEGISHLQTLSLQTFPHGTPSTFDLEKLILSPTRLEMLCISSLAAVNIDWSSLTDVLIEDRLSVADCLEVLRRAQGLTRCSLRPDHPRENNLPLQAIMHPSIIDLTVIGSYASQVFAHLECPLLQTLTINMFNGPAPIDHMADFLRRSICSVTTLFLEYVKLTEGDIVRLCQKVPTLHHLRIEATDSFPHEHLFRQLAMISVSNPAPGAAALYLPDLRSLTLRQTRPMDLALLPSIFSSHLSGVLQRPTLRSVDASFAQHRIFESGSQKAIWPERERRYLLWLKGQGVRLKLEARTLDAKCDLI